MIRLIINADDFGYSKVFNEKILELLEKGFIKSTTVLVNWIKPDQNQQVSRLKTISQRERVSTGLHCELDITKSMRVQIQEQFNKFIELFGHEPSHLDLHKLVDNKQAITEVVNFAKEHKLPVRNMGVAGSKQTSQLAIFAKVKWCFTFEELKELIGQLKDGESYELVTHPGAFDPNSKSSLNKERELEYKNIIKMQEFLRERKVNVISYSEL